MTIVIVVIFLNRKLSELNGLLPFYTRFTLRPHWLRACHCMYSPVKFIRFLIAGFEEFHVEKDSFVHYFVKKKNDMRRCFQFSFHMRDQQKTNACECCF